jgi:hypothetical protein
MRDNNKGEAPTGTSAQNPAAQLADPVPASPSTQTGSEGDSPGGSPRGTSADMQQFIGRQLRAVFDDVAKQPVPDRFLELMKQLEGKTGAG